MVKFIIYKLIHFSFNNSIKIDPLENANWTDLVNLSIEQGICAITFDAFEKLDLNG